METNSNMNIYLGRKWWSMVGYWRVSRLEAPFRAAAETPL